MEISQASPVKKYASLAVLNSSNEFIVKQKLGGCCGCLCEYCGCCEAPQEYDILAKGTKETSM